MRKLIVAEFMTMDGVVEASETWQPPFVTDDVAEAIRSSILASDAMLFGRVTYQMFAAYWPKQVANEFGIADKLNEQAKYVVSSFLTEAEWAGTTLLPGDPATTIRTLKAEPGGDIRLTGSPTLVSALLRADLVDETWLLIHPVVLGRGRRLFPDDFDRVDFQLDECRSFDSGVVLLRHRRASAAN